MGLGGAEGEAALLLQSIDRKKFKPLLIIFRASDESVYELPPDLQVISLETRGRMIFQLPKIIAKLVRVIQQEKPDAIISYLTHCNLITIVSTLLSRINTMTIVSEHSILSLQIKSESQMISVLKSLAVRILYPFSDIILAVSKGVEKDLAENFSLPSEKLRVIYNPVNIEEISRLAKDKVNHPWFSDKLPIIISVGRLEHEKGYTYLLRAFARVRKFHQSKLVILGEGTKRENLERLAAQLGIEREVAFLGFQKNPFKYVARSSIFVLSSLYEGLGNVILESMACGTPVIASDCPTGPREIIEDGFNGILVPPADESALTKAILLVLNDEKLAQRLINGGKCRVKNGTRKIFD